MAGWKWDFPKADQFNQLAIPTFADLGLDLLPRDQWAVSFDGDDVIASIWHRDGYTYRVKVGTVPQLDGLPGISGVVRFVVPPDLVADDHAASAPSTCEPLTGQQQDFVRELCRQEIEAQKLDILRAAGVMIRHQAREVPFT